VFHNSENGFCVLRVQVRGLRELQAVVGRTPAVSPGQWITASGQWVNDRSHGRQFEASYIKASAPESDSGIEKYLGSGAIPGIGPVYARKLVSEFSGDVFKVIETDPARLREVPGIGPVRAKRIIEAWDEQKVVREIMIFLHSHGIGSARAARIYKTYGADSLQVMSENPYVLSRDIRGIGFKVADGIAMKLGVDRGSPVRIRAGIGYALSEATGDGHCGLPREELLTAAEELLGVAPDQIEPALRAEIEEGDVVEDSVGKEPCLFLARLHRAERGIAKVLTASLRGAPPWPGVDTERAVPWVERQIDLRLAPSQVDAVRLALRSKVMVITGGPGVGKTTIVNAILKILQAKGVSIALCAPTGRAAKRLAETSGMEAKTIHRLLEFDPGRAGFRRNADKPLDCDLLVVDETSMVDVSLMNSLMRALPGRAALLLVGDVDQLPSVGPGQVLADLMTLEEHFGCLAGRKLAYVGDCRNNIASSLMIGCSLTGVHFAAVGPGELAPPDALRRECAPFAGASGARIECGRDTALVAGADAVYTDVWVSMGEENQSAERRALLAPYQVDADLLARTGNPGCVFMHDLPAVKGNEVTEAVFEGPASVVWEQAENRKHTARALLLATLARGGAGGSTARQPALGADVAPRAASAPG